MAETTFYTLIDNLEHYLEYQRDEGIQRIEVDHTVLAELAKPLKIAQTIAPQEVSIPENFNSLEALAAHVSTCRNCPLHQSRTKTVPGEGKTHSPDILFIGEEPNAEEDAQGRPFVGPAGQLLTKMIEAMGYTREEIFILNALKCRPPNNRMPRSTEMEKCLPYLRQQIALLKPKIIVGMGATAIKCLLGKTSGIIRLRGTWQDYEGIKLMPTFHPTYLLRNPSKKKEVWQDLQLVLKELGKKPPQRKQ